MPHPSILQLVTFISAGVGLSAALEWLQDRAALERLHMVLGQPRDDAAGPRLAGLLHWLGSRLPMAGDESLRDALARAGYWQPEAVPMFVALRLLSMLALSCLVLVHDGQALSITKAALAVFLAFLCSRIFVILLKLQGEARQRKIRNELPPTIDLIMMVLGSGTSIDQCLRYVVGVMGETAPLVSTVFRRYLSDVDSGVPYETAFLWLGQRLGIEEGYDLAALIRQALLQGGEITTSLDRFGAELAEKRVAAAREQIGHKGVQLTIAMLFFFMPVLMVVLAGPAVSNIFETLTTVKHQIHQRVVHQ